MSWGTNSPDSHGTIMFRHRSDPLGLVREQLCDDRDCLRGCWIIKAYRRSFGVLSALEELRRLDLAADGDDAVDRRHDPYVWQDSLFYGSYRQSGWRNTSRRFQPSSGGIKAAGIKVPTPTDFVVVGLLASADVGKKALLPGGMGVLRPYSKRDKRGVTTQSPGQGMFLPTSAPDLPDLPLLGWKRMQFWQRRIDSLWNRRGGLTMSASYIEELQSLLESHTPDGFVFRLLLNRPMGEDAPNISGIGGFWTDPKRRHCLGEDTPAHPTKRETKLQILKQDGEWEDWRGDPTKPPEWAKDLRLVVEEDRSVWNLTYDEDGKTKLCYFCGAKTEAIWQDQKRVANEAELDELASRVGGTYPHRDGSGFTVRLEGRSYDDFINALEGRTETKQPAPSMDTVAKDLYDALQPTEESAEELVAKFRAEISRRGE